MFTRRVIPLFVLLFVLLAGLPVAPAEASSITIQGPNCTITGAVSGFPSQLTFACYALVSGGTGSYTYSWGGMKYTGITYANEGYAEGICTAGKALQVGLQVTDYTYVAYATNAPMSCIIEVEPV